MRLGLRRRAGKLCHALLLLGLLPLAALLAALPLAAVVAIAIVAATLALALAALLALGL